MRSCGFTRLHPRDSTWPVGRSTLWPLYLFHEGAQTLNAAITLRAECTLSDSEGDGLHVVSEDTGMSFSVSDWTALSGEEEPRLVTRLLRFFQVEHLTVVTRSASPVGAGLAGSSALNIALCGALATWQSPVVSTRGTHQPRDESRSASLASSHRCPGLPPGDVRADSRQLRWDRQASDGKTYP